MSKHTIIELVNKLNSCITLNNDIKEICHNSNIKVDFRNDGRSSFTKCGVREFIDMVNHIDEYDIDKLYKAVSTLESRQRYAMILFSKNPEIKIYYVGTIKKNAVVKEIRLVRFSDVDKKFALFDKKYKAWLRTCGLDKYLSNSPVPQELLEQQ